MGQEPECFLPGTVRTDGERPRLERADVTLSLADPDDRLASIADGRRCTLGLAVTIRDAAPIDPTASTAPAVGAHATDDGLVLVGETYHTGWHFGRGRQQNFYNLTVDPGLWPVATNDSLHEWARPFAEWDPEHDSTRGPDGLRIAVEELAVAEVLTGDEDPYADRLTDVRVDFRPAKTAFRLLIGDRQLWPAEGWYSGGGSEYAGGARVLKRIGRALRAHFGEQTVDDPDWENAGMAWDHPDVTVHVDRDLTRLRCRGTDLPIGPWPPAGLRVDTESLLAAWLRDAAAFLATRTSEDLSALLAEVRDATDVEPATADRPPGLDVETAPLDALLETVAVDDRHRIDALDRVLDRLGTANADRVGRVLVETNLPTDAAVPLAEGLSEVGGLDAATWLYRCQARADDPELAERAYHTLLDLPPATVAAALFVETVEEPAVPYHWALAQLIERAPPWAPVEEPLVPLETDRAPRTLVDLVESTGDRRTSRLAAYALQGLPEPSQDLRRRLRDVRRETSRHILRDQLDETLDSWDGAPPDEDSTER